jgi:hypothetical protein
LLPLPASAWNIPGHMLSGIIVYQVLQQENPQTIEKVNSVLEKHPWYANQWQSRLQDVPIAEHGLVLFMVGGEVDATFMAVHFFQVDFHRKLTETENG